MKEFKTEKGEILLYTGNPKVSMLEALAQGPGDVWHSSLDQGFKNAFPELKYQASVFWWYINDFTKSDSAASWRVNPSEFVVRKSAWEHFKGFDPDYSSEIMQALDFGYRCAVYGAVPMYIKGLFESDAKTDARISTRDRHVFYRKHFSLSQSLFMIYRKGFWKLGEWINFFKANSFKTKYETKILPPRTLNAMQGRPTVSYIIPTMLRQEFTEQLITDLSNQSYPPTQVVVVDATPEEKRDPKFYQNKNYPFELIVKWQQTKGSCRARNEAIALSTGDYFIFGDDDICIPDDFIENHIRLLQTYKTGACNGLDIRADHPQQTLKDLDVKLQSMGSARWKVGMSHNFSNANSCVQREFVQQLGGNDVNFDGGYGEDSDFGISLVKLGTIVLFNPFSPNLHLKPASGGYRWWGAQAKKTGKQRKKQPWELDVPVKKVRPVPSPTVMYGILKHFTEEQLTEYRSRYFMMYLIKGNKLTLPFRILNLPYKNLQFQKSLFYAKNLLKLGKRTQ
ncbi:glycosyltransferase [Flavobacterium sp. SM15]|uniref:glycosyltransferase family 2 protein n=1 Tax=Flavobacterium sp. SM15 TaxID=2908005 RepID=UPI001EDC720C|nr:glycosyltransferase [Flavobacterium sp. SM15]MCG2611252.1 glycosyltransferase [Flavobacterium sp. SM15]